MTFATLYRSLLASFQCPPNQIEHPPQTSILPSTVYHVFKICGVSVIFSFPEKKCQSNKLIQLEATFFTILMN
jgi:hypothetical protein